MNKIQVLKWQHNLKTSFSNFFSHKFLTDNLHKTVKLSPELINCLKIVLRDMIKI